MKTKMLCWMVLAGSMLLLQFSAGAQQTAKPPKEWGNPIPWNRGGASVTTLPAIQNAGALCDGDINTIGSMTKGGEAGAEISFKFSKPLDITMFRFAQAGSGASHYKLLADVEGKGDYSTVIADRTDEKIIKREWIELPVNKKVFALKFVAVAGQIGYRASFPDISEIEIYSKDRINAGIPASGGAAVQSAQFKQMPPLDRRNIDIRVCTDWWNWNMNGWEKVRDKVPFGEWNAYKNMLDSFKELDINSVRLFGESDAGDNIIPFPSKLVDKEHQRDWMKPLAEQLGKDGYPVYYFTHAWKIPFQKLGEQAPSPWKRWDYPYMQSDTIVGVNPNYKVTYPCVICEDDFRVKWTQMMREALQNGAKGIYLTPDEYFFKGHNLARANCPACTAEFKKMFGYDSMPKLKAPSQGTNEGGQVNAPLPEDTEQYRKWKLFEYIKLSDLFKRVSADLKKEFPNAILVMSDNQGTVDASNCRLEHTVADDIIGTDPNADFKQVYGASGCGQPVSYIAFIKRFEASAGRDKLLSSAGWGPADVIRPANTYNGIIPQVMLGAKAVEVYRHNYIYMHNGSSVYKKTFRMIRLLEKWDIQKAEDPGLVCMLLSRAGEDWYYTKVSSMMDASKKDKAVEFYLHLADESINKVIANQSNDERQRFLAQDRMRGFGSRLTMEAFLGSNGIPYKVAYTERPDNMKNLKRFKVIVAPFAYSLSKDAFNEIKAAVEAGSKLIIFDQLAPTNEFGTPYEKPLLSELVGKPGVIYIKDSLSDVSADMKKLSEYKALIDKAIESDGYFFDNNGFPVSYLVSKYPGDQGYVIYLCNTAPRELTGNTFTEARPARVSIGLPGSGSYGMETYSSDSNEISVNKIKDSETIPSQELKRFQVMLDPQEVKLIRIYRK